jgi:hypothetical protein
LAGMDPLSADLLELIDLFKSRGVEFLVVGAHALAYHAFPRSTFDLDLWVNRTRENASRVRKALDEFGFKIGDQGEAKLTKGREMLVLGVEPNQVDILNFLDGCDFESAWNRKVLDELQGIPVAYISLEDYVATKRASGRVKDLRDLDDMRKILKAALPGD